MPTRPTIALRSALGEATAGRRGRVAMTALAAVLALAGCAERSGPPAPVVFRTTPTPAPTRPATAPAAPVETTIAAAPAPGGVVDHGGYRAVVAREGDTLESMAARAGVSPSALAAYNGIPTGWRPRPGAELILPPDAPEPAPRPTLAATEVAPLAPPPGVGEPPETAIAGAAPSDGGFSPAPAAASGGFDLARIEEAIGAPPSAPEPSPAEETFRPAPTAEQAAAPAPEPAAPSVAEAPAPATPAPTPSPQVQAALAAPVPAPSAEPAPAPAPTATFARPVDGPVTRPFSRGGETQRNDGVEFAAPAGAPVVAAADGQVALVSESLGGLGTIVLIRHPDQLLTVYGRLGEVSVTKDQRVRRGDPIGAVAPRADGDPSIHFEVRRGAEPVDPSPFLGL
ncbi:MAG: LysM peptidoglycan-binding domain-containing protein [Rhodobacteraceae bacterium]|nr:MAG: LysM peptidoglycan-binding domain-containing protein [Paracoccaceae bacterium]